jgi:plastocyanin
MSRRAATLLLCLLALVTTGAPTTAAADQRVYPARLLVYAQEWSLSPSRASLPAGRVVVQLWNRGMDPHDLRARRLVGRRMVGHTFAVHLTLPGNVTTATWTLAPGRYQLYCSLPGHMMAGMRVQITVHRRS